MKNYPLITITFVLLITFIFGFAIAILFEFWMTDDSGVISTDYLPELQNYFLIAGFFVSVATMILLYLNFHYQREQATHSNELFVISSQMEYLQNSLSTRKYTKDRDFYQFYGDIGESIRKRTKKNNVDICFELDKNIQLFNTDTSKISSVCMLLKENIKEKNYINFLRSRVPQDFKEFTIELKNFIESPENKTHYDGEEEKKIIKRCEFIGDIISLPN